MKAYILSFLLLLCSTSFAMATQVEDLLGTYTCQTNGLQATFELEEVNGALHLKYCRTLGQLECFQERVYGEVSQGQIMGLSNNEVMPLNHLVVRVIEDGNTIQIEVESDDGITLMFTR